MTSTEAIAIFRRIEGCNKTMCTKKSCKECDYYVPVKKQREAMQVAIKVLLKQPRIKAEFFRSGIEFAKTEFIRILEKEKSRVGEMHKEKMLNDLDYMQVLGLQRATELAEEVRLDEGIKE